MAEPTKRAFAEGTKRTSFQTRDDIERELRKHGASDFGFITRQTEAIVGFKIRELSIRFRLPYPPLDDFRMTRNRWGPIERSPATAEAEWERETRRLWRALYACIKAKLVAIEDKVETFEQAFFAHVVDPQTGRTLYEAISPNLALRYQGQDVPLLEGPNPVAGGSR